MWRLTLLTSAAVLVALASAGGAWATYTYQGRYPGPLVGQFPSAFAGIAVDSGGVVYISDRSWSRVYSYTAAHPWAVIANQLDVDGPCALDLDSNQRLWSIDHWPNNPWRGRAMRFGSPALFVGANQLNSPNGIAFDSDNDIYIADTSNHRIVKYNAAGNIQAWAKGGQGSGSGQFLDPEDVAVDSDTGALYVTDTVNNRIAKYDLNGNLETSWATGGYLTGLFYGPRGIAVGPGGLVAVADYEHWSVIPPGTTSAYHVHVFDRAGNELARVPMTIPDATHTMLGKPFGVAFHPITGDLYVTVTGTPGTSAGSGFAVWKNSGTKPTLTTPVVSAHTVYAKKAVTASGYLKPHHLAGAWSVAIKGYRYDRVRSARKWVHRWVWHKTWVAKNFDYSTYTRYVASITFPSAGSWRIRAYLPPESPYAAVYSGYRSGTVKPAR